MEIKTKVQLIFLTLSVWAGSYTLIELFRSPIDSGEEHSIQKIAYKAKKKSGPTASELLLHGRATTQVAPQATLTKAQSPQDVHFTQESFHQENITFLKKLNYPQNEVASILGELSDEHEYLMKNADKSNLQVEAVDRLKPKMRIFLAYTLGVDPSTMTSEDLEALNYSGEDWYFISYFVNSNDFKLLLAQNRVRDDILKVDTLVSTYETNDNIRNRKRMLASIKEIDPTH